MRIMEPTPILYLTHSLLFLALLIIFVSLAIIIYLKYQDMSFFQGIFLAAFINFAFVTLASLFIGYIWVYFSSVILGFMAGIINKSIKLSILSGAEGIFFSWMLPLLGGIFYNSAIFGYLIIASLNFYLIYIIPSILCGALGGLLGGVIIRIKGTYKSLDNNEEQTIDQERENFN